MEWNPVTDTLHRALQDDVELLIWREPDAWAWAAIRITGPNSEANVVLGTGEGDSEEEARAKAEHHANDE
jgi:hypothetical protein